MQFPKIPKPLLIVIVIIVILGVVSCGAGVFRGLTEEDKPAASGAADKTAFGKLELPSVKAEDVTVSDASGVFLSSCSKTDEDGESPQVDASPIDDITISTACDVTVEGQFLPQVLRMTLVSSTAIAVQQELDGRLQPDSPEFEDRGDGASVDVSVTGTGQAHFRIRCGSCVLRIAD